MTLSFDCDSISVSNKLMEKFNRILDSRLTFEVAEYLFVE